MLDPQEVKQFQEIVQQTVKVEIAASEQRMIKKIDAAVSALEQRMIKKIDEVEKRLAASIKQLGDDIGIFMDTTILPQIEEKAGKKEVKLLAEKTLKHEATFKKLKAVFVN